VIEEFANGKVRSWASILDDVTREQAIVSSTLPILAAPIALMPDAHLGWGATVGSVLVTEQAVIPMAVGVDIGCGMAARKVEGVLDDLEPGTARSWVRRMAETVPAGLGKWLGKPTEGAQEWMEAHAPSLRLDDVERALVQLGTLGSGNHFVELSVDEAGGLWILLHSGSRGAGNKLATIHGKIADVMTGDQAPKDLAWLPSICPEFRNYLVDLYWSQAYALENRRLLLRAAHAALEFVMERKLAVEDEVNCHHNYAVEEFVEELGHNAFVTRKGAIRARVGDRGLIPGAMGQASFVVSGLGNPASYESCSHGAGRLMSRKQARREIPVADFTARMAGVEWQDRNADQLLDEAPQSYKDVETVIADQADLVRIDYRLRATANYKGLESGQRPRKLPGKEHSPK
jgi:tRNA-splicing ligase RtcB (3'-phosphate/5'-hydroxy nucleic acid ligase)